MVTKSNAPSSNASIVSFAPSFAIVLTIITFCFIPFLFMVFKNSIPFIFGIFISKMIQSNLCPDSSIFIASRPFVSVRSLCNSSSEFIISDIILLISAESSIINIFFNIFRLHSELKIHLWLSSLISILQKPYETTMFLFISISKHF